MLKGTVKFFDEKRGFGFITPDEGNNDAFVHHSAIQMEGFKTLREGQRVQYTLTVTVKGPQAIDVEIID